MLKLFKEWWYSDAWQLVTVICGKRHQHDEHYSSHAMYWCHYNIKLKQFKIHVGHVTIIGKCKQYPQDDFFLPYIFHEDFDASHHNPIELVEQRKLTNDLLNKAGY